MKTQNVKPKMDNENYLIKSYGQHINIMFIGSNKVFFSQFCQGGGLVIIPNKNEPNLVRGHTFE